jgi:hypothetical protein
MTGKVGSPVTILTIRQRPDLANNTAEMYFKWAAKRLSSKQNSQQLSKHSRTERER